MPTRIEIAGESPLPLSIDGYSDPVQGLEVSFPEGWTARPGPPEDALRLVTTHTATGSRVEVRALAPGADQPPDRSDCEWTFVERGHWRAIKVSGEVVAATCTPLDPTGPRVVAWLVPDGEVTWLVEALIPSEATIEGRRATEELLERVRW